MISNYHIIHERSNNIPINNNSFTNINKKEEYSLKQNFFDPTKSSPPNEFMIKLQKRFFIYHNLNNGINIYNNQLSLSPNNVVNLDKE